MVVSVVVFSRNFYCCCCCFCSPLLLSHWLNSEIYDRLVHFCIDRDTHTGYTMVNLNIMCFIISYCSYNFRILLTGRAVWIFPFCEYAKKKNRRRRQEKKTTTKQHHRATFNYVASGSSTKKHKKHTKISTEYRQFGTYARFYCCWGCFFCFIFAVFSVIYGFKCSRECPHIFWYTLQLDEADINSKRTRTNK